MLRETVIYDEEEGGKARKTFLSRFFILHFSCRSSFSVPLLRGGEVLGRACGCWRR